MGAGARVAEIDKFPGRGLDRVQQSVAVGIRIKRVCACIGRADKDASISLRSVRQTILVSIRVSWVSPDSEFLQIG